jgi:hypothetical protein
VVVFVFFFVVVVFFFCFFFDFLFFVFWFFCFLCVDFVFFCLFFFSDALRVIKNSEILYMNYKNIIRDYISFYDLFQLIIKFIDIGSINTVVDAYSKEHIDKISLLNFLNENFGLDYEFRDSFEALNGTGSKDNYY